MRPSCRATVMTVTAYLFQMSKLFVARAGHTLSRSTGLRPPRSSKPAGADFFAAAHFISKLPANKLWNKNRSPVSVVAFSRLALHISVRIGDYKAPSQNEGIDMACKQHASNEIESPTCLMCGGRMRSILIEEEYPGYERQMFACQLCDGTMTQWCPAPIQAPTSYRA